MMRRIITALIVALALGGCASGNYVSDDTPRPKQAVCINLGNGMTGCQYQ